MMMTRENDGLVCFPPELIEMLWGSSSNVASIFDRWSQAFEFSRDENSALIQLEGGPCSVLTPVQAHLLEQLIFSSRHRSNWRQASQDEVDLHFLNALISILDLLCPPNETIFLPDASLLADQRQQLTMEDFHRRLTFRCFRSRVTWKKEIFSRLSMWKQPFGILLFLYSCLMTKTFQRLKQEIDDETSLPLIDSQHGHGSQALTNLLITGSATPHCFDGEKDISGLKLKGIEKQASIGFLSTLESYRLMEVGWFLKNPRTPIWILASETHLTVFFSPEKSLVQLDQQTPKQQAQTSPIIVSPLLSSFHSLRFVSSLSQIRHGKEWIHLGRSSRTSDGRNVRETVDQEDDVDSRRLEEKTRSRSLADHHGIGLLARILSQ